MSAIEESISRANIIRNKWPVELKKNINLYQGSGSFGSCFDAYGLMHQNQNKTTTRIGETGFYHQEFFHRGAYGLDMHLLVARLCWDSKPKAPREYTQKLNLFTGKLSTSYENKEIQYTMESVFDPYERDLFYLKLDYVVLENGLFPDLIVQFPHVTSTSYNEHVPYKVDLNGNEYRYNGIISAGTAEGTLTVLTNTLVGNKVEIKVIDRSIRYSFSGKRGSILFLFAFNSHAVSIPPDLSFFDKIASSWRRRWGDSYLYIEDKKIHNLWTRGLYYLLCSYAPNGKVPSPPMGWTGNNWNYHFPQDVSFFHPVLLKMKHFDIARSIVEYYHSHLENMKTFTKRIYNYSGVMWAWEFPASAPSEQLKDGSPNHFQYEIHNSAYVVRMAYETWRYTGDDDWGKQIAWPIVRESCLFYLSALKKNVHGTWGLHIIPSMGQDEYGGKDKQDYLCSLFSAQYCMEKALEIIENKDIKFTEAKKAEEILKEGLSYPELYCEGKGVYKTCGSEDFEFGLQKHPVQLNPLNFVPLKWVDGPTNKAYEIRHSLCQKTEQYFYNGWTLFAFMLAAVNREDVEGFNHEIKQLPAAQLTDPDEIMFYETSGFWQPYYTTSHGLFMQAVLGGIVNDFSNKTKIGCCAPDILGDVMYSKIRTIRGEQLSGCRTDGTWNQD